MMSFEAFSQKTDVIFTANEGTLDSRFIRSVKLSYADTSISMKLLPWDNSCTFKCIPFGETAAVFHLRNHDSVVLNFNLTRKQKTTKLEFPKNTIFTHKTSSDTLTKEWKNKISGTIRLFIQTQILDLDFQEQEIEITKTRNFITCTYFNNETGGSFPHHTLFRTKNLPDSICNEIQRFELTPRFEADIPCYENSEIIYSKVLIIYDNYYLEFKFCPTTDNSFVQLLRIIEQHKESN